LADQKAGFGKCPSFVTHGLPRHSLKEEVPELGAGKVRWELEADAVAELVHEAGGGKPGDGIGLFGQFEEGEEAERTADFALGEKCGEEAMELTIAVALHGAIQDYVPEVYPVVGIEIDEILSRELVSKLRVPAAKIGFW
jgi:hypothetical protein